MALIIKVDGTKEEVRGAGKGGKFTLEQMYQLLGCTMVQLVPIKLNLDGTLYKELWCDEDGKMNGKPRNKTATFALTGQLLPGDFLVGPVLLVGARKKKTPQPHDWMELGSGNGISNFACARCGALKQIAGSGIPQYHLPGKKPLDWQARSPACHPKESR